MKTKWKSCERLKKRLIYLAAASMLATGLLAGALMPGGTAYAAPTLDLDRECGLQVKVAAMAMEEGGREEMPDVAIDLYKVADAEKEEGYDAYRFVNLDAFAGLECNIPLEDTDADDREIWTSLAQQAAARVFEDADALAPVVEGAAPNGNLAPAGASGLEPGLYLMIVRGNGLEREEYIERAAQETGDEMISTIAYSDSYTFAYSPQLVALPTKDGEEGGIAVSNPGDWLYELELEPKYAMDERFADLRIDKELTEYLAGSPATFVFTVEAMLRDRLVYSNAVSLTFDGPGVQSELIADKIPVGAVVTVTEVYSGATYQMAAGSAQVQTVTIANADSESADFANIASFQNTYDGSGRKGAAITNHFEYTDDGAGLIWNWTQNPGRTPAEPD